jgi:hypothetical protein
VLKAPELIDLCWMASRKTGSWFKLPPYSASEMVGCLVGCQFPGEQIELWLGGNLSEAV